MPKTVNDEDVPPPEQYVWENDVADETPVEVPPTFDRPPQQPAPPPAATAPLAISTAGQFTKWDPSEDQVRANKGILDWFAKMQKRRNLGMQDILTIGGYAGTGKTALVGHTAVELMSSFKGKQGDERISIAFATYTGKASQVLESSLAKAGVGADYVGTIHRLIYRPKVDGQTGRVLGWERQPVLPYDLIIIDEASMVPTAVAEDLMSFKVPMLAVGDHGQLAPVGEDAGLMADPHHRLETIHRQAKGNPIIELSMMIRQGKPLKQLLDFMNRDATGKLCWFSGHEGIYEALEFAGPPGLIVSFTNRQRVQTNKLMRKVLKKSGPPQKDEIVICVKNAYLESGLLANGARGQVISCTEHPKSEDLFCMVIDAGDGRGPISLEASRHQWHMSTTFKGFDEVPGNHYSWDSVGCLLDYGYALTCHKSQGSQAQSVAVLVERALGHVLDDDEYRRWLYTAATRSADRLMFVTDV